MFEHFHFLNPEYLLALFPLWIIVYLFLRAQNNEKLLKQVIDPELLPYLLEKTKSKSIKPPLLLGIVLSLMLLVLSGPAYKLSQTHGKKANSEIVFVLNVTESMQSKDLMPNRFHRALLKIDDFLSLNSDIKTALIAYSGSAHLVMPLIQDKSIISKFSSSLSPQIMPIKGDALYDSIKLASKQFVNVKGSIVVLTDALNKSEVQKVKEDSSLEAYKIIVYNISSQALQKDNIESLSLNMGAQFISFSINEDDINTLHQTIEHQYVNAEMQKEGTYVDSGYELLVLIIILLLFFFRKGFANQLWSFR